MESTRQCRRPRPTHGVGQGARAQETLVIQAPPLRGRRVALKQGDRMMVITQTCDIIKPPRELPQIEGSSVSYATANDRIDRCKRRILVRPATSASTHQAREEALILDYGQRALLDKGFLEAVGPTTHWSNSWTADERKTAARWLGQRYSRPAIPDKDYEQITGPVRSTRGRSCSKRTRRQPPNTTATMANGATAAKTTSSLTLYLLSLERRSRRGAGPRGRGLPHRRRSDVFHGPVTVATDQRSYHTFAKAEE